MFPIKNIFNEYYPADCSRKTRQAFIAKAKNGEFIGSQAPYGYRKSKADKHVLAIPVSDYTLYITENGKSLLPDEKAKYLNNNLNIVTAYQNDGRKYEYFTEKHAKLDALSAVLSAKALGQPYGTTIYFAVDYDADISQLERIRNYFNIVKIKLEVDIK